MSSQHQLVWVFIALTPVAAVQRARFSGKSHDHGGDSRTEVTVMGSGTVHSSGQDHGGKLQSEPVTEVVIMDSGNIDSTEHGARLPQGHGVNVEPTLAQEAQLVNTDALPAGASLSTPLHNVPVATPTAATSPLAATHAATAVLRAPAPAGHAPAGQTSAPAAPAALLQAMHLQRMYTGAKSIGFVGILFLILTLMGVFLGGAVLALKFFAPGSSGGEVAGREALTELEEEDASIQKPLKAAAALPTASSQSSDFPSRGAPDHINGKPDAGGPTKKGHTLSNIVSNSRGKNPKPAAAGGDPKREQGHASNRAPSAVAVDENLMDI